MTPQPQRRPWVRRHPILTVLWLLIAGFWLIALVSIYDDDLLVSILAYLFVMTPTTLVIFGLGVLIDRVRSGREGSGDTFPLPSQSRSSPQSLALETTSLQHKLDNETRRQRDLTIQLGQREADLGRREADLRVREALLLSEPQERPLSPSVPQPLWTPESKPSFDPAVSHPDRLPDQSAPARFCFNCGAWFARDDETCRLCGARRVGSDA